MSERFRIEVDGAGLEARLWPGDGTPVLLLHEGLGCLAAWRAFPEKLAAATGRPVAAWSRRGFGRSAPFAARNAADYLHREAALLPKVMDALGLPRAHLFGHSDGASIALIAAGEIAPRVASLVLEAPHVLVEDVTVEGVARARETYRTTNLAVRLARYHAAADAVFRNWNDIWLDPAFRDWNIEQDLLAIRAPALLIQGLDDEYATLEQLNRIEARLPGTRRLVLGDCGHAPHREREADVLHATCVFLDGVEQPSAA